MGKATNRQFVALPNKSLKISVIVQVQDFLCRVHFL